MRGNTVFTFILSQWIIRSLTILTCEPLDKYDNFLLKGGCLVEYSMQLCSYAIKFQISAAKPKHSDNYLHATKATHYCFVLLRS